ncbi:calcineurin-like phosphoesterase C-terminal domain-containing protein [Aureliella helgolandensis]|nr:calcineurin-like phosphoesterase family protein [Aureliella helgolandensis]
MPFQRVNAMSLTGWLRCLTIAGGLSAAGDLPALHAHEPQLRTGGAASSDPHEHATGYVYHDLNGNQTREAGEVGLEGIKVSNGRDIVTTDAEGRYEIGVDEDTIVFVIKPRGFISPLNELNLPQFYYIHKPAGSPASAFPGVSPTGALPESVDFALQSNEEPSQFKALLFGDTQPRNVQEVEYMAHDIVEQVVAENAHGASLGVTLGDIVFNDLSVFGPHNQAVALIGIPWFNVIGNHDINLDAADDRHSDETFESHYGPSYYSFDYGTVHFLALDDVMWHGPEEGRRGNYTGGLGEAQMEFIRNDLKMIPEDQLVVLMMHIPLVDVEDRQELYRLIEQRPFAMSMSAHTHYLRHRFIGQEDGWMGPEPHHHLVNVTVCGSWWRGTPDELGIPNATMSDGGPNGYSIISFDGTDYDLEFRAARRPENHQMNIYLPQEIATIDAITTAVVVNVFNGSEKSTTRMRILPDGEWKPMERVDGVDPFYTDMKKLEAGPFPLPGTPLPGPSITDHLWRAFLPAVLPVGTHMVEVETTDMDGHVYTDHESLRVVALPRPTTPPENAERTSAGSSRSRGRGRPQ